MAGDCPRFAGSAVGGSTNAEWFAPGSCEEESRRQCAGESRQKPEEGCQASEGQDEAAVATIVRLRLLIQNRPNQFRRKIKRKMKIRRMIKSRIKSKSRIVTLPNKLGRG